MKRINYILFVLLFNCVSSFAQTIITTPKDGYLVYDYNGSTFKSNKKIKKGTTLTLVKEFDKNINFYVVLYKEEEFCLNKNCINETDIDLFIKAKADNLNHIKHIKDSIEHKEDSIRVAIFRRKNDSINNLYQKEANRKKQYSDSIKEEKRRTITQLFEEWEKEEKRLVMAGMPIEISYLDTSKPNSVGGTDLIFHFKNISLKTIKYISVTGFPLNPVKDKCYCSIRKYSQTTNKGVGPIDAGECASYDWENVWYNQTISTYVPITINIKYMDGSSLNITGEKLKRILDQETLDKIYEFKFKSHGINKEDLIELSEFEK